MTEPSFEMAEYIVICEIEVCENFEIAIEISASAVEPVVYCGGCANQITNITEIAE